MNVLNEVQLYSKTLLKHTTPVGHIWHAVTWMGRVMVSIFDQCNECRSNEVKLSQMVKLSIVFVPFQQFETRSIQSESYCKIISHIRRRQNIEKHHHKLARTVKYRP